VLDHYVDVANPVEPLVDLGILLNDQWTSPGFS
jgi:hypothetical protein